MKFWWVNQNQTARHEIGGGYMWSPKRTKRGERNPYYENMRECAPGDVVFSFVDTKISTLGIVTSLCEESPKPDEFGTTGDQWDADGWLDANNGLLLAPHIDHLFDNGRETGLLRCFLRCRSSGFLLRPHVLAGFVQGLCYLLGPRPGREVEPNRLLVVAHCLSLSVLRVC